MRDEKRLRINGLALAAQPCKRRGIGEQNTDSCNAQKTDVDIQDETFHGLLRKRADVEILEFSGGSRLAAMLRVEGARAVDATNGEDVLGAAGMLVDPIRQIIDVAVDGAPAARSAVMRRDLCKRVALGPCGGSTRRARGDRSRGTGSLDRSWVGSWYRGRSSRVGVLIKCNPKNDSQ